MKKLISIIITIIISTGVIFSFVSCNKNKNGEKISIVIDGGGDTANLNSSLSMQVSETNPYPYNTLEVMVKEWQKTHTNVNVSIRKTSFGGDRDSILPLLKRQNAPDIIYQNATVLNSDLGKGYYVPLKEYFDKPNPYNDNKLWKEVYSEGDFANMCASDGDYYYVNLERYAIGILYNKKIFNDMNLEAPETFEQFMAVQKSLKDGGKTAFLTSYPWYDIALETNVFSNCLDELDVIYPNGKIEMEEFCRGYELGIWKPTLSSEADYAKGLRTPYEVYVDLICEKKQYEPVGAGGYDTVTDFLMGNVGMIEATSETMRKVFFDSEKDFDVGVIGYPYVPSGNYQNSNFENGVGESCYRGSAGTATSWWITNTAVKNKSVDACVDLLMYLTSPTVNNKLIGDIKGAIPLDPNAEVDEFLEPLVNMYKEDSENENKYVWGAISSWNTLGLEYNSYFLSQINQMLSKRDRNTGKVSDIDKRTTITNIIAYTNTTIRMLIEEYQFDESKW